MAKIVTIGGGTGMSVLLRGLKNRNDELTAVVSVADDGGSSGMLREDLGMLPPGDIRSCLLALATEESDMQELFNYRFKEGHLKNQNIGNLLIAAYNEIHGNFEEAISKISNILKVKGKVIPVSGSDAVLCAELDNGNIVVGESHIPRVSLRESSSIKKVFFESDDVTASDSAKEAIEQADIILIGPGSLYTSIIPNFLVEGISDSLSKSMATKIYVGNVMTQPGETDNLSLSSHIDILHEYTNGNNIDYVIANDLVLDDEITASYREDGAVQIIPTSEDKDYLANSDIHLVSSCFVDVKKGFVRHDAYRISDILDMLLEN